MAVKAGNAGTSELVDCLVQLSFAIQDVLAGVAAEHNLSITQLRLLGILRDRTPPMTAIAEHLGLDRSSVTGLVSRAERRGLVSRTVSMEDARVTIVSATPEGRKVGRELASMVATEIDALVAHVPEIGRDWVVHVAGSVLDARTGRPSMTASR